MENWIIASATSIQALILFLATLYARKQVIESKELREIQTQPYVVASFQNDSYSQNILVFNISNLGASVAKNIKVSIEPPLKSSFGRPGEEDDFSSWLVLSHGISTLVPKQSINYFVDVLHSRLLNKESVTRHEVTVTFSNSKLDKHYSLNYTLDIGMWIGSMYDSRKTLDNVVQSLDSIKDAMNSRPGKFSRTQI
jgi:hypothetical protein